MSGTAVVEEAMSTLRPSCPKSGDAETPEIRVLQLESELDAVRRDRDRLHELLTKKFSEGNVSELGEQLLCCRCGRSGYIV